MNGCSLYPEVSESTRSIVCRVYLVYLHPISRDRSFYGSGFRGLLLIGQDRGRRRWGSRYAAHGRHLG